MTFFRFRKSSIDRGLLDKQWKMPQFMLQLGTFCGLNKNQNRPTVEELFSRDEILELMEHLSCGYPVDASTVDRVFTQAKHQKLNRDEEEHEGPLRHRMLLFKVSQICVMAVDATPAEITEPQDANDITQNQFRRRHSIRDSTLNFKELRKFLTKIIKKAFKPSNTDLRTVLEACGHSQEWYLTCAKGHAKAMRAERNKLRPTHLLCRRRPIKEEEEEVEEKQEEEICVDVTFSDVYGRQSEGGVTIKWKNPITLPLSLFEDAKLTREL
jgi:hypothetical protein